MTYGFSQRWRVVERVGLPHSAIRGSRDMCSSPRLFAAYHGLLRTVAPRHPPWTLSRLTIFSLSRQALAQRCSVTRHSGLPSHVARVPPLRCQWTDGNAFVLFTATARTQPFALAPQRRLLPSLELSKNPYRHQRRSHSTVHWRYGDLNPRPMACKATALATELYPR